MFGSHLNRIRKTFVDRKLQNFGSNAGYALLSAPEKLTGQAKFCAVHCTFLGCRFQEAIDFVTMRQVDRGHWNSQEKEYFYVKRAEALGVQSRGGDRKSEINPTNVGMVPSAKDHADALGVADRTVERWEKDRKEIMSDPVLSLKTDTFEDYREAKQEIKERKARTLIVPDYDINEAMGAILGISMMYAKEYTGEPQDAAQVLLDRIMEGYDTDDIGLSMARDCAKWFLSLKKVMDLVEPELEDFLTDKPNLTVVN